MNRAGTAAPPGAPAFAAADRLAELGLILLLVLAPLPFGSVHPPALFALCVWTAALAWLVLPRIRRPGLAPALRGWPWLLAGILALGAIQLAPLPRAITTTLSSAAVRLKDAIPLIGPAGRVPLGPR